MRRPNSARRTFNIEHSTSNGRGRRMRRPYEMGNIDSVNQENINMDTKSRGQAYQDNVQKKIAAIEQNETANLRKAGEMIADAYQQDRLIHVYGGGGHTVMMVCEMFFRAGG